MTGKQQQPTRRLAAILHADVAGFSALMSADEAGTQAAVAASMARAREMSAKHGGRVVGTAGDAFLAEFPSVVAAVAAAVEFQEATAAANAEAAGRPAVAFRIGVNLGDVIAEGDDIFGEGVNVAARVEALAPPGGVAVTQVVKEQVGSRLDVAFADGGVHRVKNIPQPVRIFVAAPPFRGGAAAAPVARGRRRAPVLAAVGVVALALAAGAVWRLGLFEAPPPAPQAAQAGDSRPVVAVLPFSERGAADGATYFADGFTEDVIAHMGRFAELLVLSWNAVAPYRGKAAELDTLKGELNARYVIGGSIRQAGDRLRVSVQLTDARDGVLLWSERYDAPTADLFDVQDRIAGAAAGSLAVGVVRVEQQLAMKRPTETLDAYDLALRGRALLRRVNRADNLKARDFFERALRLDPHYADARAGLAWTHVNDVWWGWSEWPDETIRVGFDLANRALSDDPRNMPALTALSELQFMRGELDQALGTCLRAIEINPNDARAQAACGGTMIFSGDPEGGVPHCELALRLDPEPTSWDLTNLAIGYYMVGRYEDAAALLGRSTRIADEDPSPHAVLAAVHARLGEKAAARAEVERTLRLYPFFDAEIFANNLGKREHARELLEGLRLAGFR